MGRILKSLTLGGILGFVAGILMAPWKGDESRQKLKEAVDKGKAKFNEITDKYRETGGFSGPQE